MYLQAFFRVEKGVIRNPLTGGGDKLTQSKLYKGKFTLKGWGGMADELYLLGLINLTTAFSWKLTLAE